MERYKNIIYLLVLLLSSVCFSVYAQGIPYAMKYQAVLHDVEGKVISNRSDISLRITLRESGENGAILYREDHKNISTDAFGVVQLVIGRGQTNGTTLEDVSWGSYPIYVQVELEMDGSGYTQMGVSELLSVPYAIYAANAGDLSIGNLAQDVLPKYDMANRMLVNSGVFQNNDSITVKSKKVVFDGGISSYTFPMVRGIKGQVLKLGDDKGNLVWAAGGSGGATGGPDERLDQLGTNNYMVYWDNNTSSLRTSELLYDHSNTGELISESPFRWTKGAQGKGKTNIVDTILIQGLISLKGTTANGDSIDMEAGAIDIKAGDLYINSSSVELNGLVKGSNNIMLSDLSQHKFWMGDAGNKAKEIYFSGNIRYTNDTAYFPEVPVYTISMSKDTVFLDSNGIQRTKSEGHSILTKYFGVWRYDDINSTIYNNGDTNNVRVGIGTANPNSKLHLSGGAFIASDKANSSTVWPKIEPGNAMIWGGKNGAFRVGGVTTDAWEASNVGNYSIGLGFDTKATKPNTIAIGYGAVASAENTVTIGTGSRNSGDYSIVIGTENLSVGKNATIMGHNITNTGTKGLALGYGINVLSDNAIGIGIGTSPLGTDFLAKGSKSVSLGYNIVNAGEHGIAIGGMVKIEASLLGLNSIKEAIAIGNNAEQYGPSSILFGNYLKNEGDGTMLMGTGIPGIGSGYSTIDASSDYSINLGTFNTVASSMESVTIGASNTTVGRTGIVNIGAYNNVEDVSGMETGSVAIGYNLTQKTRGILLGAYNDVSAYESPAGTFPAFVVAAGEDGLPKNIMELSSIGTAYISGDLHAKNVYANGILLTSDRNLKTDIKPIDVDNSVLAILEPVSFVFKEDLYKHLHFGFIAQEVEQYFPHLVFTNKKGEKSLNYVELIPILWKYVKDLEEKVEEQEKRLQKLEAEVEQIKLILSNGE